MPMSRLMAVVFPQAAVPLQRACGTWALPSTLAATNRRFFWTTGKGRPLQGFGSHTSNNDPRVLDEEKVKSLKGQVPTVVPGAPGWNEKLASDSEAVVKAERMDQGVTIRELQEHTIKIVTGAVDPDELGGAGVTGVADKASIEEHIRTKTETTRSQ